jgi:LPS export ABC transporter protein LptC
MKRPFIKYSPLAIILLLLIIIGFYLIKARHQVTIDLALLDANSGEGLRMTRLHFIQNNPDEGMKWILDAEQGTSSKDMQHIQFEHFRLKLEPENGPSVELEGGGGEYDKNTYEINLQGDLQGITDTGYKILTNHMVFHQKERTIKSEEPVKIIGPFFSVEGKGLFMNMETDTLRVLSDVTTRIDKESLVL